MYPITNSHRGGQDLGVPFVKGVFQILISPPPADPHNHRAEVVGMRPCPHQHGDILPMLRACGLVQFRRGVLSRPPLFSAAGQVACSDKGSGVDFWGNSTPFFFKFGVEFPLKYTLDLKGLEWIFGGNPTSFFLN